MKTQRGDGLSLVRFTSHMSSSSTCAYVFLPIRSRLWPKEKVCQYNMVGWKMYEHEYMCTIVSSRRHALPCMCQSICMYQKSISICFYEIIWKCCSNSYRLSIDCNHTKQIIFCMAFISPSQALRLRFPYHWRKFHSAFDICVDSVILAHICNIKAKRDQYVRLKYCCAFLRVCARNLGSTGESKAQKTNTYNNSCPASI